MQNQQDRRRALRPRRQDAPSPSSERELHTQNLLYSLGLEEDAVDTTMQRIATLGDDPVDWLLVGLEAGLSRGARSHQKTSVRQREVERLMEGFSTELIKLDEVVDVLATFVNRMRIEAKRDTTPDGVLH